MDIMTGFSNAFTKLAEGSGLAGFFQDGGILNLIMILVSFVAALGTGGGALRFSFSHANSADDVDLAARALRELADGA